MQTFARWISMPENSSATAAVKRVLASLCSARQRRDCNPLYLHGPAGSGKSHLVQALVSEFLRERPGSTANVLPASDLRAGVEATTDCLVELNSSDLLVIEDLQHFAASAAAPLVQLYEERRLQERQMVFTANVGPRDLTSLPFRLTSRLAAGLVVGLQALGPVSRHCFLADRLARRQTVVSDEMLAWLAARLPGSGRQLEAAAARLEALSQQHGGRQDLATVAREFANEAGDVTPSLDRIIGRVSSYFGVDARQVRSRRRGKRALIPRQVSMYLARRLTPLSLVQIGASFASRDHSTVLHACRKIESALSTDTMIGGAVRQLEADLV